MHEELEGYKTKYYAAKISEKSTLDQLYEVRDRMLKVAAAYDKHKDAEYQKFLERPKTYTGLASDLQDPVKAKKIRKKELKAR